MSNFFRDSSLSFKPRSNIFSKLRVKDPEPASDSSITEDGGSSLMRDVFLKSTQMDNECHTPNTTILPAVSYKASEQFQLNSSTPKNSGRFRGNREPLDEDDLEITEVRDVLGGDEIDSTAIDSLPGNDKDESHSDPFAIKERAQLMDTSSNDVLLEAFTNTQKICSNLKQELQRQQSENSKLKSQLSSYQKDNEKIIEKFSEYKKLLNSLEEKSASLSDQKVASDTTLKELKESHERFEKKIDGYKISIAELQTDIADFKLSKRDADSELGKKSREIEYLKRELNDCSGQLSEEKLKNNSLMQELVKIREEIMESMVRELATGELRLEGKLSSLNNDMNKNFERELKAQLCSSNENSSKRIIKEFSGLKDFVKSSVEGSAATCARTLKGDYVTLNEQLFERISEENEAWDKRLSSGLISNADSQNKFIQESVDKSIGNLQLELISMSDVSTNLIHALTQSFTEYRDEMITCKEYRSKIDELQSDVSKLQLQKSQALSSLGTKEAQYEEVTKNLNSKNIEISKHIDLETELRYKMEAIVEELQFHKNKLIKINEENITLKANSENKIAVQGELLKALQSENDIFKQRNRQLDFMREQNEKDDIKRITKIQTLNENLQKLNVEIVQLKAHELELEEENRNLKNSMDNNRLGFEENNNELKLLQQKLIVLQADKQDIVTEKLDLQDKIDDLQNTITNLKQKVKTIGRCKSSDSAGQNPVTLPSPRIRNSFISNKQVMKPDSVPFESETLDKCDEFDLSSSLNDDLELTNPSPIEIKTINVKRLNGATMKPPNLSRKKLLLFDEDDSAHLKHRWKKRRA